ncbi:MAG: TMEM165/GDT1 family protein [Clostridiales Family XIII bacterium]|nr:TMEM165/GDT1 family protein [Clostridiales Family XIII bacterium]
MTIDPAYLSFLAPAGAVLLAEMGDKTQLLAIAFAAKYKASKVLCGVLIATVLNHAMAVAAGAAVTRIEAVQTWIEAASSIAFILFGIWTLRGDSLKGEERRATRFGPVMTVAIAFFIAEMGDKTQLVTLTLAARFPDFPALVLAGTTAGMLIADGIGIAAGTVMRKRIPEKNIRLVSAAIFVLFGLVGIIRLRNC